MDLGSCPLEGGHGEGVSGVEGTYIGCIHMKAKTSQRAKGGIEPRTVMR